ncbi:hypothetical protein TNCV_30271 [Trichonephila clavipes]|nr:hypothetical protein TNCV_30271 [Trichonephila clavipes]
MSAKAYCAHLSIRVRRVLRLAQRKAMNSHSILKTKAGQNGAHGAHAPEAATEVSRIKYGSVRENQVAREKRLNTKYAICK